MQTNLILQNGTLFVHKISTSWLNLLLNFDYILLFKELLLINVLIQHPIKNKDAKSAFHTKVNVYCSFCPKIPSKSSSSFYNR